MLKSNLFSNKNSVDEYDVFLKINTLKEILMGHLSVLSNHTRNDVQYIALLEKILENPVKITSVDGMAAMQIAKLISRPRAIFESVPSAYENQVASALVAHLQQHVMTVQGKDSNGCLSWKAT